MTTALLKGIRVLDLSRTVAAPFGVQMLADFGAEVIKVERPGAGDEGRGIGPTFLKDREGNRTGEGSMYLMANRNKRGITANLAKPAGQELVKKLIAISDVLVENYKVGDMARYGLDYESVRKINPKIIYCSVTGFGQNGPYASRPGYDPIFQAQGGWMALNGQSDDKPVLVASNPADVTTGYHAAIGILGALLHRERGGEGQHVDVALLDVAISAYGHRAQDYLLTGQQPARRGLTGQLFPCSDGKILIAVANKGQWVRFCEVIGRKDMADDPRYDSHPARMKNGMELYPILEGLTVKFTTADLSAALEKADIPFGPVLDYSQVFADPQVIERKMEVTVPHPLSDDFRIVANPIKFSGTPITEYTAPPLLGQHQQEILGGLLGLTDEEIAALKAEGAI